MMRKSWRKVRDSIRFYSILFYFNALRTILYHSTLFIVLFCVLFLSYSIRFYSVHFYSVLLYSMLFHDVLILLYILLKGFPEKQIFQAVVLHQLCYRLHRRIHQILKLKWTDVEIRIRYRCFDCLLLSCICLLICTFFFQILLLKTPVLLCPAAYHGLTWRRCRRWPLTLTLVIPSLSSAAQCIQAGIHWD